MNYFDEIFNNSFARKALSQINIPKIIIDNLNI